jgi:catechol-2,3-dioxygenase
MSGSVYLLDMKIKHLDHINMTVNSFQESASWYKRVFGFEIVEEGVQNGQPWGVLRSGDALLCIYQAPGRSLNNRFELADLRRHGVSHFAFRIQDEQIWNDTIAAQNLEILYDGEVLWTNSKSWYLKDPTGYEIEVALWKNDEIALNPPAASAAQA